MRHGPCGNIAARFLPSGEFMLAKRYPNEKQDKKKASLKRAGITTSIVNRLLAEREGFEPSVPCSTPDFESGTIDHSATSPQRPR
jgi:hypothetical protein